jgi:hypothetical protein
MEAANRLKLSSSGTDAIDAPLFWALCSKPTKQILPFLPLRLRGNCGAAFSVSSTIRELICCRHFLTSGEASPFGMVRLIEAL